MSIGNVGRIGDRKKKNLQRAVAGMLGDDEVKVLVRPENLQSRAIEAAKWSDFHLSLPCHPQTANPPDQKRIRQGADCAVQTYQAVPRLC